MWRANLFDIESSKLGFEDVETREKWNNYIYKRTVAHKSGLM